MSMSEDTINKELNINSLIKEFNSIKTKYYTLINTANLSLAEENIHLRIALLNTKRYVLKNKDIPIKTIDDCLLQVSKMESKAAFYSLILRKYQLNPSELGDRDILVELSTLLYVFKRTNCFICNDDSLKHQGMKYFQSIMLNVSKSESVLKSYINMFEIYDALKGIYEKEDVMLKYPIDQAIMLLSLFFLKEKYDYHSFIMKTINKEYEYCLPKIIQKYSEALEYLMSDDILKDYKFDIPNVTSILQIAFLEKNNEHIKKLIDKYTIISSDYGKDCVDFSKAVQSMLSFKDNETLIIRIIEELLGKLIEVNIWEKAFQIVIHFKEKSLINRTLIQNLVKIIPYELSKSIATLIEIEPSFYENIVKDHLNKKKFKEVIRLVTLVPNTISLSDDLYEIIRHHAKKRFYLYKYEFCKDKFDILIDYISNDSSFLNYILKLFLNKPKIPESLYLIKVSLMNNIELKTNITDMIQKKFGETDLQKVIDMNHQWKDIIIEDSFKPKKEGCFQLDKAINVVFADTVEQVSTFFNVHLIQSEYIGIDSEWKQNYTPFDKPEVSILQLCDHLEKNVLIIDMIKLGNNDDFIPVFSLLQGKRLIGFSFESSDITNFTNEKIISIFSQCPIIDLGKSPYSNKSSLSTLSKDKLKIDICKYEQCSNWKLRPLRQSQIHYAALDALICIKLYKCFPSQ